MVQNDADALVRSGSPVVVVVVEEAPAVAEPPDPVRRAVGHRVPALPSRPDLALDARALVKERLPRGVQRERLEPGKWPRKRHISATFATFEANSGV